MTYKVEIEINAPVEKIADLLSDHEQMKKWIKELESYEHISGEPREPGAKTKIRLNAGAGIDAVETLEKVEYPSHFTSRYEIKGGSLVVENDLKPTANGTTLYSINHKFKFSGPLSLITALMKPAFIKHSEGMVEQLKKVAEK